MILRETCWTTMFSTAPVEMIHFLPVSHVILICNQTRYYHVISKFMIFFEEWMGVLSCVNRMKSIGLSMHP